MTIIHVFEMNVTYFMHITGHNSLYLCIETPIEDYFINEWNERGEYILT